MISEQEIKNWWERKIENYLQNYARRNKLTIAQEKEKFFTETREVCRIGTLAFEKALDEKVGRN